MRPRKYIETLTIKISKNQRQAIEAIAERDELSISQAARELLSEGLDARGIKC